MNKKVIIGIVIGVLAAICIILVSVFAITGGKGSKKAIAKDFTKAIKSEEAMEKFVKKHVDFKTYAALNAINGGTGKEKDELEDALKDAIKEVSKEDIDEAKEECMEEYKKYVDEELKLKFKKLEDGKEFKMVPVLKQYTAVYEDSEGDEVEYAFIYYKDKLVLIAPEAMIQMLEGMMETTDKMSGDYDLDSDDDDEDYSNAIDSAKSAMSKQEVDIYNAKLKPYIGEYVKGSEVKAMIDTIISMNQSNVDQDEKFVRLDCYEITGYDGEDDLYDACFDAWYGNNEENVKKASEEMTKLKAKINSQKNYEVEASYDDGIIYELTIYEAEEDDE